ncbi:MAG: T9SS type A sorting domain-containing protein [Bacteroidetes bacterium]|nr:T9SS type A sorting domain-containing protein [Bacteroidota bacterium]
MKKFTIPILVITALFLALNVQSAANKNSSGEIVKGKGASASESAKMNCLPPSSDMDLTINNVRTKMQNGGDMFWDLDSAKYEIPAGSGIHSIFTGALWIGGFDAGNNLKIAAMTYRSMSGYDFWPGPLDATGQTNQNTCTDWDQHWGVMRTDILAHIADYNDNATIDDPIPNSINDWPAKGNPNNTIVNNFPTYNFAPFFDQDNDGLYDPTMGDYPDVLGDQAIWWIFNDAGNAHTSSKGQEIGMEIHAQAFAAKTNNILNDVTFYSYLLINRGSNTLDSTFFGQWIDADLGCHTDDYVGCDTSRNMGICYNGDADDDVSCIGGVIGYGSDPPLLGVSFFEGPKDTMGNEIRMAVFTYYNNDATVQGNPDSAHHYYNYLTGTWKDNRPFTFGGTGYLSSGGTPYPYMFPDEPKNASGWSECSQSNLAGDRRFVMSAGPFTLLPGAVNNLVIAVTWVRPSGVYPCPGFSSLQLAMDTVRNIYDSILVPGNCLYPIANFGYSQGSGFDITFTDSSLFADTWFWDFSDGGTSTQQNPTYSFSTFGNFKVCLSIANICSSDSFCFNVTVVDTGTSIIELPLAASINIYPSLVNDQLFIETRFRNSRDLIASIYDLKGELVYQMGEVKAGSDKFNIDMSKLPVGLYFVRVSSGKQTYTQKVTKLR